MLGTMSIEKRREKDCLPHAGFYEICSLVISVGHKRVVLSPHLYLDAGHEGVLVMQGEHEDGIIELQCDLGGEQAEWLTSPRAVGLAGLWTRCAPDRLVPLNEALFKEALNEALLGPQPILIFDPTAFMEKLGFLAELMAAAWRLVPRHLSHRLRLVRSRVLVFAFRQHALPLASLVRSALAGALLEKSTGPRPGQRMPTPSLRDDRRQTATRAFDQPGWPA